jgi:hypothetical protein
LTEAKQDSRLEGIEGAGANVCKTHVRTIPDKIFANIVCNTLKMSEVAP